MKKYYIFTSLIYADSSVHLGHIFEIIIADFMKYLMKKCFCVKLIIGMDDHGNKIKQNANKYKTTPILISNLNTNKLLAIITRLNIKVDGFIKTSYKKSVDKIKKIIKKLTKQGNIKINKYYGWFSKVTDTYCSNIEVTYSKNLMYTQDNIPVEWTEQVHMFMICNERFKQIILFKNNVIYSNRSLQIINMNKKYNTCISRINTYGLKLKINNLKFNLWVWFEALLAYYIYKSNRIHIIGKDIIKFHLDLFSSQLLKLKAKLPIAMFQHGLITTESAKKTKLSKTLQNYNKLRLKPELRHYICSKNFNQDVNYKSEDQTILRKKLKNNLGNLIKRTTKLLYLYGKQLKTLSINDWIIICYIKNISSIITHVIINFNLNLLTQTTENCTIKLNIYITKHKLWENKNNKHNLMILHYCITALLKWLKYTTITKHKQLIKNYNILNTNYNLF